MEGTSMGKSLVVLGLACGDDGGGGAGTDAGESGAVGSSTGAVMVRDQLRGLGL